jgi:phosphorylcholine metabolism protein LicD
MSDDSPCTAETRGCADARDYNSELRECCRGHVVGLMNALVPMLNESRVTWWADYGTLLGAVRNPLTTWADYPWLSQEGRTTRGPHAGIIPHDKDADLGILAQDWTRMQQIKVRLEAMGFTVLANPFRLAMKLMLSAKNHANVDMFFWLERPDGTMFRRHYISIDQFKGRDFPRTMLRPMTTVQWEGMTIPAPRDPHAFLEMRYGPGWRTPIAANNDGVER